MACLQILNIKVYVILDFFWFYLYLFFKSKVQLNTYITIILALLKIL